MPSNAGHSIFVKWSRHEKPTILMGCPQLLMAVSRLFHSPGGSASCPFGRSPEYRNAGSIVPRLTT